MLGQMGGGEDELFLASKKAQVSEHLICSVLSRFMSTRIGSTLRQHLKLAVFIEVLQMHRRALRVGVIAPANVANST